MTIVRKAKNAVRQAFHKIADRRRRRRDQRRHEHLLRLAAQYNVPAFLMLDDPQLPPRPPPEKRPPKFYPARISIMPNGHVVSIPAHYDSGDS